MSIQFTYIGLLLLVGASMGMVYDVYNTVTGASKWLRWLRPTLDIAFWLSAALCTYYVVYVTDNGKVRFYTFGLLLLGFGLYRLTLHRTVVGSAFVIVRVIEAVIRKVLRLVYGVTLRPLLFLLSLVMALARAVYKLFTVIEGWLFQIVRFWLNVLLVRWLIRLPKVQQLFSAVHRRWEDLWTLASKWLKKKLVRV